MAFSTSDEKRIAELLGMSPATVSVKVFGVDLPHDPIPWDSDDEGDDTMPTGSWSERALGVETVAQPHVYIGPVGIGGGDDETSDCASPANPPVIGAERVDNGLPRQAPLLVRRVSGNEWRLVSESERRIEEVGRELARICEVQWGEDAVGAPVDTVTGNSPWSPVRDSLLSPKSGSPTYWNPPPPPSSPSDDTTCEIPSLPSSLLSSPANPAPMYSPISDAPLNTPSPDMTITPTHPGLARLLDTPPTPLDADLEDWAVDWMYTPRQGAGFRIETDLPSGKRRLDDPDEGPGSKRCHSRRGLSW
ncbi:ORF3R [Ictalurid herpesvirus 1]|nr:ORF3L [Ictalurid herpesvirus 1]QAB08564.1 ORF3R [Ictalurid herpesvirus 1]